MRSRCRAHDSGTDLCRGRDCVGHAHPDRPRADPRAPAQGEICAPVARDGCGPAHPLCLARRADHHRRWLGVSTYPPAILFAVATLFIIIVLLHYSTVLSSSTTRTPCSPSGWLYWRPRSNGCAPIERIRLDDLRAVLVSSARGREAVPVSLPRSSMPGSGDGAHHRTRQHWSPFTGMSNLSPEAVTNVRSFGAGGNEPSRTGRPRWP